MAASHSIALADRSAWIGAIAQALDSAAPKPEALAASLSAEVSG